MRIFTKEEIIRELLRIKKMGWIQNKRPGNVGGVGNTLEDLLGIKENNLPLPNATEWELKCQRMDSSSLTTLFHLEPSPRALKFVPKILLPLYGWPHKEAGKRYPADEMSFRQTINAKERTDRGFGVIVDRENQRVLVSFDWRAVSEKHKEWLRSVERRVGLGEISPQPYWGFDDLFHKAGTKLHNCFYIKAKRKRKGKVEFFYYEKIYMLENFSKEKFIKAIESGIILIDFDARTGHNHGTKFRMRQDKLPELYEKISIIEE